mgnify:CR=1 FL=1
MGKQLEDLSEHVQERRSELLEVKLQTDKHRSEYMLQLLIILNEIFGVLLPGQKFPKAFVSSLPDSLVYPANELKHGEDYFEPDLDQLVLVALLLQHHLARVVDAFIQEDGLQET